jgi:hypothetical protein
MQYFKFENILAPIGPSRNAGWDFKSLESFSLLELPLGWHESPLEAVLSTASRNNSQPGRNRSSGAYNESGGTVLRRLSPDLETATVGGSCPSSRPVTDDPNPKALFFDRSRRLLGRIALFVAESAVTPTWPTAAGRYLRELALLRVRGPHRAGSGDRGLLLPASKTCRGRLPDLATGADRFRSGSPLYPNYNRPGNPRKEKMPGEEGRPGR